MSKIIKKNQQVDFFIADIFETISLQCDISSLEFPLFALKAGTKESVVKEVRGFKIEITPSFKYGLASIHDKDIWIYCVSKLMQAIREEQPISRVVCFYLADFFKATGRASGGKEYSDARKSLHRLKGTVIHTDIKTEVKRKVSEFSLIEDWEFEETKGLRDRARVKITLPNWLYQSVLSKDVLTLSSEYFSITKPLERRMYELSRKHCGEQSEVKIGLDTLYEKSGSFSAIKGFKQQVKTIIKENKVPTYKYSFNDGRNIVINNIGRIYVKAIKNNCNDKAAWSISLQKLHENLKLEFPLDVFIKEINTNVVCAKDIIKNLEKDGFQAHISDDVLTVINKKFGREEEPKEVKEKKPKRRKFISYSEAVEIGKPQPGESSAFNAVQRTLKMNKYEVDLSEESKKEYYDNLNALPKTTLKPIRVGEIILDEDYVNQYREKGEDLETAQERLIRTLKSFQDDDVDLWGDDFLEESGEVLEGVSEVVDEEVFKKDPDFDMDLYKSLVNE